MSEETSQNLLIGKQQKAIEALLTGSTRNEAAMVAGVSVNTVYRWLQDADFQAELRRAKSEAMDEVGRSLLNLGVEAVKTIREIMSNQATPAAVRARAANDALTQLFKMWETMTVEERLAAIEARLNGLHGNGEGNG